MQRGDNRRIARTGPLGGTETHSYDGNGNLIQQTDRRGFETFAGFGKTGSTYESVISYVWEAGNRLIQAVDSIAGTIVRIYDGPDDLTDEQSPQGEVTYAYDAAHRRTSMTEVGQNAVSYTYDNANRLTQIAQGSSAVGFSYDNANRRTSLALPNGIVLAYTYDQDSRVTGMTWTLGQNPVGDLEYSYDADSHVVGKGGTFATTGMPLAVTGNTFNEDNEMLTFGAQDMTYDPNGNLISDGLNTYIWDARNHLASIAGANTASFTYDPFGRRVQKTVNGLGTQFLYDRRNPVEELQGGSPSANLLTGLRIDEYFSRADSAGARNFLTDILGSTLALTDSSGSIQTSYTYEPFGNATVGGQLSANPYQFTGREDDGTGLYFYRARFYSPTIQRFVAQDPVELIRSSPLAATAPRAARYGAVSAKSPALQSPNVNLYDYGLDSPTNWKDAAGLCQNCDPEMLNACLNACALGEDFMEDFCRGIPDPRVRLGCWAVVKLGEVACAGWCQYQYGCGWTIIP